MLITASGDLLFARQSSYAYFRQRGATKYQKAIKILLRCHWHAIASHAAFRVLLPKIKLITHFQILMLG